MIKTDFNNDMEDSEKYAKTGKVAKWVKGGLLMVAGIAGALFTANQINKNNSEDEESDTEDDEA